MKKSFSSQSLTLCLLFSLLVKPIFCAMETSDMYIIIRKIWCNTYKGKFILWCPWDFSKDFNRLWVRISVIRQGHPPGWSLREGSMEGKREHCNIKSLGFVRKRVVILVYYSELCIDLVFVGAARHHHKPFLYLRWQPVFSAIPSQAHSVLFSLKPYTQTL